MSHVSPTQLQPNIWHRFAAIGAICCLISLLLGSATTAKADVEEIDDTRIEMAVESELWSAKGVNANNIDVSAVEGVVTLSGNVDSILAKQRAVRVAQMIKGVRSVVDQIDLKTTSRPDEEMRLDVVAALAEDPATDLWQIDVEVRDGMVTLDGSVDSWAEHQLAEKVAKANRGVKGVTNDIDVEYNQDRSDSEIQEEIKQRLKWDVRVDDNLVNVQVKNGDVTLSGTVGSAYEKTIVNADARVSGVKEVNDDDLSVAWWARDEMQRKTAWVDLDDEEIEQAVNDALMYDPRVFSFRPTVSVDSGIVTLTGVVDNLKAKRAAAQDAKNTVGVIRVKNYLKVRPAAERPDDEIKQDILSAFSRDPYVSRVDVRPVVVNGEVWLHGDVNSYYEKAQAEDLAATVNGVANVNNLLDVSYDPPVITYDYYDWDPVLYDYDFDYETTRVKPDNEIKEEIESELWWSPWVDSDEVNVTVDDGTATLTGTVESLQERSKAGENAIEGGAVKVVNKLNVST